MKGLLLFFFAVSLVSAQDPLKLLPANYRLVFQNEFVRVIHVTYRPFERLPVHNHSEKPTVYVYLTDSGPVRFSHIEDPPFRLIRPPEKAGTFRFSPGRLEKHEVENLGAIPSEFLRVELTQLPLGYNGVSFRSPKSFDGVHTGVRTEFETGKIKIQRIVAAPREVAEVQPVKGPSLLVSFSPASVRSAEADSLPRTIAKNDVLWIAADHAFRIVAGDPGTAGHLLQIIFEPRA